MLSKGNTKMGNIYNFNLPAIITCPGATEICLDKCYAKKGRYIFSNVKNKYYKNLAISLGSNFDKIMSAQLKYMSYNIPEEDRIIRIHSSGDFYSIEYVRKWNNIIKENKDWTFYAYTRSWRIDNLRVELEKLMKHDNMSIYGSTDESDNNLPKNWELEAAYLIEPTDRKYIECYRSDKCKQCMNCVNGKKSVRFMTSL